MVTETFKRLRQTQGEERVRARKKEDEKPKQTERQCDFYQREAVCSELNRAVTIRLADADQITFL